MDFDVVVNKQTTETVRLTGATDAEDAITKVRAGSGTVTSQSTVSVQYVPRDVTPAA